MNWYSGELSNGILKVKKEKRFLFVFCKDDEQPSSGEILSILDDDNSSVYCKDMICLLLSSNSEAFRQFSSIYNVPSLPCIHIILPSGAVFAVRTSDFSPEVLSFWLKTAHSEYLKTQTTSLEDESKRVDDVSSSSSKGQNSESAQQQKQSTELSVEEKLEHARKLLEAKRNEELQQEFEKTRLSEIERRKLGKGLADFKQRQQEDAIREQVAERKRAKAADKAARERVLRQIEIDREDRERLSAPVTEVPSSSLKSTQPCPVSPSYSADRNLIRLQIRLPDGANISSVFQSSATLANEVRQYIENRVSCCDLDEIPLNESIRSSFQHALAVGFTFRQLRPARRFTAEDECLPLKDLDLWPSAILVLCSLSGSELPSNTSLSRYSQGAFGQVVLLVGSGFRIGTDLVFSLGSQVVSYGRRLFDFLTGRAGSENDSRRTQPSGRPSSKPDSDTTTTQNTRGSNAYRRHGNISRLSHMPDDADEQARWNGNSTTQL